MGTIFLNGGNMQKEILKIKKEQLEIRQILLSIMLIVAVLSIGIFTLMYTISLFYYFFIAYFIIIAILYFVGMYKLEKEIIEKDEEIKKKVSDFQKEKPEIKDRYVTY